MSHTESVPLDHTNAEFRVGYLEECLRHISDIADKRGHPYVSLAHIRELAVTALRKGDPLTCPEARK